MSSFPGDLNTIIVTGTYKTITGQPLSGQVSFGISVPQQDSAGEVILGIQAVSVPLNSSGYFSVTLACTDNANLNPGNFTYLVTEQIPGLGRSYSIALPHSLGATVDLSQLAPVVPPPSPNAFGTANTWTATQTFGGSPGVKITQGAVSGDVLTSDGSGNGTWQAPNVSGIVPPAGDIGGSTSSPTVVSTHLSSALPFAQGGTGQGAQQAAMDALAGAQTSGQYLRGNGSHVVMSAVQAADLPAGTTSVQGALQLDGTAADIQPIGMQAAGAVGKPSDAGHVHPYEPWQFYVKTYGAKGDGQLVTDGAITNGQATLTTGGLSAPASPTLSNSGSGGSLAGGTYQVKVTFVNRFGETVASSAASQAISGTQPLTITSPAEPAGEANGWYAYVTTAGGSTFYRQQTAGSPTPVNINLVLTANPSTSGANPPGANTSQSNPFTSTGVDGGKAVHVGGAGGGTYTPLCTTISTVTNTGTAVLAVNATSTVTNAIVYFGTDDTAAIQSAVNAAAAYAAAHDGYAEILFDPLIYVVAGAPVIGGTTYGNAQITLPVISISARRITLVFRGTRQQSGNPNYTTGFIGSQPYAGGTVLACARNDGTNDGTNGPAAVIGGPYAGFLGDGPKSNLQVAIDGTGVLLPYNGTYAGWELYGVDQVRVIDASVAAAASPMSTGPVPSMSNYNNLANAWNTGIYMPDAGSAGAEIVKISCTGLYTGVRASGRTFFDDMRFYDCLECFHLGSPSNTAAVAGAGGNLAYAIDCFSMLVGSNASSQVYIRDFEGWNTPTVAYDPSNYLRGQVGVTFQHTPPSYGEISFTGAANLRVLDLQQNSGPVSSPQAAPATTVAWANQYYRDADMTLSVAGGTLSALTITGPAGTISQTIAASTTFYRFLLPSGLSYTPTYTGTLTHTVTLL